jgi:hypothetical protein
VAFHLKGRRLIPVNIFRSRKDEDWRSIEKVNGKDVEEVTAGAWIESIFFVNYLRDEIWELCDRFEELSGLYVLVGLLACDST